MYHAYFPTALEVFLIVVCLQLQHCNFCFGNANEVWQHIPRDFQGGGHIVQKFYASVFIKLLKQAGIEAFADCV